jgi:hypothetical protein
MAPGNDLRDFWVAAAAAAPIIALANQVALTETFPAKQMMEQFAVLRRDLVARIKRSSSGRVTWNWSLRRNLKELAPWPVYYASYGNFLAQAIALYTALGALSTGRYLISPMVVIIIETLGLVMLVSTGMMSSFLRAGQEREKEQTIREREEQARRSLTPPGQTTHAIDWALQAWRNAKAKPGGTPQPAAAPSPDAEESGPRGRP